MLIMSLICAKKMIITFIFRVYLLSLLVMASSLEAKSFIDIIKNIVTFNIPSDIFEPINKTIIGKIKAKNVKFIVPNKIEMDDVEVLDEFDVRVLYGKHVSCYVSLISLLTNNIRITDALVDSPYFYYNTKNDVHNIIRVFDDPPDFVNANGKSKLRVTIENVSVVNGQYEMAYEDNVSITASGISAKGNFWVEDGPFFVDISRADIAKGNIKTAGMTFPIANLVADNLIISDEKVSVKDLSAKYEKALLKASGSVFIAKDKYDINATIDAPSNTYPEGLIKLPLLTPKFFARINMSGLLTEPQINADINMGNTEYRDITIKPHKVVMKINEHVIDITQAEIAIGDKGRILAHGSINIDNGTYKIISQEQKIDLKDITKITSNDLSISGMIDAQSIYIGSFKANTANVHVISKGVINNVLLSKMSFKDNMAFNVDANYSFNSHDINGNFTLSDSFSRIKAKGKGNINKQQLTLNVNGYFADINDYYQGPYQIKDLNINGQLNYHKKLIKLAANANIANIKFNNIIINNIVSKIKLLQDNIYIDSKAKFNQGIVASNIVIENISKEKLLKGTIHIANADLRKLGLGFNLPISGTVNAFIGLDGSIYKPKILFSSNSYDVAWQKIKFNKVDLVGQFYEDKLTFANLDFLSNAGNINGKELLLNFITEEISGDLFVNSLDIASLFNEYDLPIGGKINGPIKFSQNFLDFKIFSPLWVNHFSLYGIEIGDGSIDISFGNEILLGNIDKKDLTLSLSGNLSKNDNINSIQFSYAINHNTVNLKASVLDMELDTSKLKLNFPIGVKAKLRGNIDVSGSMMSPSIDAYISSNEFGFFDSKDNEAKVNKVFFGPALIKAHSNNKNFDIKLSANLLEKTQSERDLLVSLDGKITKDGFIYNIDGHIHNDHLEDILVLLKKDLINLNSSLNFKIFGVKKWDKPIVYDGIFDINNLSISMPKIDPIILKDKVSIKVKNNDIKLLNKLIFNFSPGILSISGSYLKGLLDISFDGDIPLIFSRFFFPLVRVGDGLAEGKLTILGSLEKIILDGYIRPKKGAIISLQKWIDPIEFRDGFISFKQNSSQSFTTKFHNFVFAVGDGKVNIDGSFIKNYAYKNNPSTLILDIKAIGSNIVLRDKFDFIEIDFDINTKKEKQDFITQGNIIITDGAAHRQFDFRNFVAEIRDSSANIRFMENIPIKTDIDISVRQFKASARIFRFDLESIIKGQLSLRGDLSYPKLGGTLFINEGLITFPAISFDLNESQIVFAEDSKKLFNPNINITATQDLDPMYFPSLKNPTTVGMSLRGQLDKFKLEFASINGDKLDQLAILLLLLSPKGGIEAQTEILKRGADNAAMVLSEVFLKPLTNELGELLEGKTKTRIQIGSAIEPTGVSFNLNWKLGPRLEVQGSYMFVNWEAVKGNYKSIIASQTPIGDLKMKIMLFDHRPLGPLFLETSFESVRYENNVDPRAKIRLKYRIISK